jgi:hypothetical protein
LPVPAADILDVSGAIRSQYVSLDYKTRIDPDKLLIEARNALRAK